MRNMILRLTAGAACLLVAACGGGGGGGDGNPPPTEAPEEEQPPASSSSYPELDEAAAVAYAESAEFNEVALSLAEEEALRQSLGLPALCSGSTNPDCASASNYALQNIHYAHTATLDDGSKLRGQGMLIAVVDDGFRRNHREFSGKTIHTFFGDTTSFAVEDHGTSVAGIAAGNADGVGTMGVAPEADLHLTSWKQANDNGQLLDHLASATNDAAARGAVVQNNSWGFSEEAAADEALAAFRASGMEFADFVASEFGGTSAEWQRLFDSYDSFQQNGVIVFANSNNSALGVDDDGQADASALPSLPLFLPELEGAWLTVSNALFTVDESDGRILEAELLSAPCGSAAEFCLTNDGSAYAPTAESDTSYGTGTGTSFSTPQISGQIALLAQAFPNLSPEEWTTRLLATSRTDWEGFQDTLAGSTTFAPGVTHAYSSLYGHGVPDMKAALEPVGGLSIASGDTVFSSERTSLSGGVATAGPVVGNAVAKALAGRDIMVIDALGADFYLPASTLGAKGANGGFASGQANAGQLVRNVDQVATSFSFLETDSVSVPTLESAAVPKLFFSQAHASLGGETAFSRLLPLGEKRFLQFTGHMEQTGGIGSSAAFSLSRLTAHKRFATELSFSFGHTTDRFFGNQGRGPFLPSEDTGNMAAGFGIGTSLSPAWSVSAYAELGSGLVEEDRSALVDYGTFAYASGGVSARRHDVFTGRDTLDFYGGIRPKAVAGEADLRMPVGRDIDGTIHYEDIDVDLAEADLPLRLGFVYRNRTERDFDVLFGFNTDFTAGSDPDPVLSVSLGLKKSF